MKLREVPFRRQKTSDLGSAAERALDALIARESELLRVEESRLEGLDNQATAISAAALVVATLLFTALNNSLDLATTTTGAVTGAWVAGLLDLCAVACGVRARSLARRPRSDKAVAEADARLNALVASPNPLTVKKAVLDSWESRGVTAGSIVRRKVFWVQGALAALLLALLILAGLAFLFFRDSVQALNF